jgi:hypothetical protein
VYPACELLTRRAVSFQQLYGGHWLNGSGLCGFCMASQMYGFGALANFVMQRFGWQV